MIEKNDQYIYIVISKTNTMLGRFIQNRLRTDYNHCSLGLDEELEVFYAFGRKQLRNMFRAGFVEESKSNGFFKQYGNSKIIVLRIAVTEKQYADLVDCIEVFKKNRDCYKYSALGLLFCHLGIPVKRKDKYFCAQFVAEAMRMADIPFLDKHTTLVRPHDFLEVEKAEIIYQGPISNYSYEL